MKLSCSLAETRRGSSLLPAVGTSTSSVPPIRGGVQLQIYGLSPTFEPYFLGSGLEFVARDEAVTGPGLSLARSSFFVGTLFQPERRALPVGSHPLVYASSSTPDPFEIRIDRRFR